MANVRNMWRGLVAIVTVTAAMLTPATTAFAPEHRERENGEGKYANLTAHLVAVGVCPTDLQHQRHEHQPRVGYHRRSLQPLGQEGGIGPGNKFFFLAGTFRGRRRAYSHGPEGQDPVFPISNDQRDNARIPPTDFTVPELRTEVEEQIAKIRPCTPGSMARTWSASG